MNIIYIIQIYTIIQLYKGVAMLREEYLNELRKLNDEFKEKASILQEEGANDEAILEKIKANVCDIFYTIFNVSYKKTVIASNNESECYKNLYTMYNNYFDSISAPWKEKLIKDKENNMFEELYKEQIKLETAASLRELFKKCYSKYYKGEEQ